MMGSFQVFFQSSGTFNVNFSFPTEREPLFAVTSLQQGGIAAKPNDPDISGNSYTATIDFSGPRARRFVPGWSAGLHPGLEALVRGHDRNQLQTVYSMCRVI